MYSPIGMAAMIDWRGEPLYHEPIHTAIQTKFAAELTRKDEQPYHNVAGAQRSPNSQAELAPSQGFEALAGFRDRCLNTCEQHDRS